MPERVTPEERLVSLAIEKARKAAEVLRQREPTQVKEVEHEAEDAKLKRPKAQADKTKINTQSEETHSGYGLAGQEMKKGVDHLELAFSQFRSLIGKKGDITKLTDMLEKEFGKSTEESSSSFSPSLSFNVNVLVEMRAVRGKGSQEYEISDVFIEAINAPPARTGKSLE